jgi:hypothetical protein
MHKHARRKKQEPANDAPVRFFERELAGEDAPSFQSMQTLYQRTAQLHMREPWNDLLEEELIVVEEPFSNERCFCSVMGSLGVVKMLQTYIGASSYFWFRKAHAGYPLTAGDFYANQRSVSVQFVPISQLAAPDRDLLKVMGHPLAKGMVGPIFRAIRPGYHPWFVTEREARILTTAIEAVLAVCDLKDHDPDLELWEIADVYPFVTLEEPRDGRQKYHVGNVDAPRKHMAKPTPAAPDTERIQKLIDRKLPVEGTLEVDHFYTSGMIGEKHARKACLRIALAIEAKTALALPPTVGSPQDSTGEILQQLVLSSIEARNAIPSKLHVRERELKSVLAPLAQALRFDITVKKSLPALDFAKRGLQAMLDESEL